MKNRINIEKATPTSYPLPVSHEDEGKERKASYPCGLGSSIFESLPERDVIHNKL
ncbi:MAG: hypothetical protein J6Y37_12050 [Paludibacteraceae bacterium]|nr:hypothetical protein [Paludibacteraceae bacterium]